MGERGAIGSVGDEDRRVAVSSLARAVAGTPTPILGINGTVIIAHGISKAKAIKNMILNSYECAQVKLSEKIAQAFSKEPVS